MAKFTSFHLKGGQIFYAKTGAAVPANYASKLTVDLAKKTVYKDGRKVGTLRQKTLSKKASATINRNIKRRPRVPAVDMGAIRGGVKGGKPILPTGGVKIEIDRDAQGILNFNKAVDELVRLGEIDNTKADAMKVVYEFASKEMRSSLWDEVHGMFEEYGYTYETVGWTD